jgi:hypothetical protein
MERYPISYKQEVRGSSPRPPTIVFNHFRDRCFHSVVHFCSERFDIFFSNSSMARRRLSATTWV